MKSNSRHSDSRASSQDTSESLPYSLMLVLLSLYFAQGLPSGFITQALPAILRQYDVSLRMIGWSGLLLAPWALKFLWAPVVDKYFSPRLGRARSWILPLQLLSAVIVFAVGFIDPNKLAQATYLWSLFVLLFVLSMVGATHDVATDSLATRTLSYHRASTGLDDDITEVVQSAKVKPQQNPYQGLGNAMQVVGYRLGLILGGGVFLMVLGHWSWQLSFTIMALFIVMNLVPIWRYPEARKDKEASFKSTHSSTNITTNINTNTNTNNTDTNQKFSVETSTNLDSHSYQNTNSAAEPNTASTISVAIPNSLFSSVTSQADTHVTPNSFTANISQIISKTKHYLQQQYGYFWANQQMRAWLVVLLTFKIADGISSGMVKPMMVDMGIATASIGLWVSVVGSVASLIGAGAAAWVLKRVAHYQALLGFNVFQLLATGLYALVAVAYEYQPMPLAMSPHYQTWLFFSAYAANAIEHMAAAMALVAMLTMVMHYARHERAGSDFTTQVCLLTVFSGSSHLLSGYLAEWLGYAGHFLLSVVIGACCLLPILYWQQIYKRSFSH